MIDALARERRKNVCLALALSAGLHVAAMMTLDLSPGSWRHGVAPALRVTLKQAPGELLVRDSDLPAGVPEIGERARRKPDPQDAGLKAQLPQPGASLPSPIRYYRNSEVDVPATPVERGTLEIPEYLYLAKLAGTVKARVFINEDGAVESVQIVEVKPRAGLFEQAALEALRQVRYKPAERAGQPVKSQKLIEVTFDPYEEPAPR